ncbi:MAG: hypothetical protein IH881_10535 [Myxococcales bacterium]|nr:hypothetical protein [Myxococcales bacterium]
MRLADQNLVALPIRGVVLGVVLGLVLGLFLTGCTPYTKRRAAAIYDPAESLTEIVAVLRRHVPDDTYRFPPGRDFTGRNVYRSTLLRLENIERIHSDELRSGYMDAVIDFSKARSLERLRGFDLAARLYREAARKDRELRDEALRSANICEAIYAANQIGIDLPDPVAAVVVPLSMDTDEVVVQLDRRIAELLNILAGLDTSHQPNSHYRAVIRQEIERADVIRSHYFLALRHVIPDGSIRSVAELQKLLTRHGASQNRRQHMLELADLYATISREYVQAVPPESLHFDPPKFQELVDAAVGLYRTVAAQDGTSEKLEATRRLEAFLAFTLRVDRDRFAQ